MEDDSRRLDIPSGTPSKPEKSIKIKNIVCLKGYHEGGQVVHATDEARIKVGLAWVDFNVRREGL